MKPRIYTAILLFISSFSPLFAIIAVKDFDFSLYKFNHKMPTLIMISIVIISIILLFLVFKKINRGNVVITAKKVGNRSTDLINYTIPYMIAFVGINVNVITDIISVAIFLIILMLLTITSKSVFINPVLALAGYGLYDLEYIYNNREHSTIAICKHNLIAGNKYYIRSLTQFMSVITGEYND